MKETEFVEDTLVPWDELPAEVRAAIGPCLPEGHSVFAWLLAINLTRAAPA